MDVANVLISNSWGDINEEIIDKGVGGREGALIHLSLEWAKQGHKVVNFVNVEKSNRVDFEEGNVNFVPLNMAKGYLQNFPQDITVAWECPSIFDDPEISKNTGMKLCEMQVCHLGDKEMVSAGNNLDYMCTLSEWHKNFLLHSGLTMDAESVLVFPNGINLDRFPGDEAEAKFNKPVPNDAKFVYSSSPDRGLWYLLQIWSKIREEFTEATLDVCYGLEEWANSVKWAHARIGEMAVDILNLINQPGINNLGKIGQDQLSNLQLEADAWLYPFDPMSPTESGCITAIENAAAGNALVTTNADCMEDEFGKFSKIIPLPFKADEFAEETITYLKDTDYLNYTRTLGRKFAEKRDWSLIAQQWNQLFLKGV